MTDKKPTTRLIPTMADIIFITTFLYLSLSKGQDLLADGDTGFHIRTGEYILDTFSIPRFDLFSYITPTLPWTAHEWLAEVIMAVLYRGSGLTGVVVFYAFLIALVYYLLTRQLRSYNGNIFIATAIVVLVAATSQVHWLARPHIFSLLIMVVWYRILDNYQYRDKKQLYWLPLLMLLWVNLHGGYLAGFIFLGIYFTGNLVLCVNSAGEERAAIRKKYRHILKISLLTLLASLANPIGYKILLFPFNLVNNKYIMDHVVEFISPNFHEPIIFKYLFLLTIALLAFSRKRLNLIELLLLLCFTNMALFSIRYVTLFALVIAPIILFRADDLMNEASGRVAEFFRVRANRFASMESTACGFAWPLIACIVAAGFMASGRLDYQFSEKLKPVAAVEFLKREKISGHMFNNDEFGDYIIYAAWPDYRVFFDGRSDMYGTEIMKEYYKISNSEPGWEGVIEKYNIDWIIFDTNSGISRHLLATKGWRLIYADRVAHIFTKEIPRYEDLIRRYKDVKPLPPAADKKP